MSITAADRQRLVEPCIRVLMTGCLLCVGGRVFALRERGEIIDDGITAARTLENGVFERLIGVSYEKNEKKPIQHWCFAAPETRIRELLETAFKSMSEDDIAMFDVGLTATCALRKGEVGDALRTGRRLVQPPTDIIGDTPNSPEELLAALEKAAS